MTGTPQYLNISLRNTRTDVTRKITVTVGGTFQLDDERTATMAERLLMNGAELYGSGWDKLEMHVTSVKLERAGRPPVFYKRKVEE